MAIAQRALSFSPLADLRSDRSLVRAAQSGKPDAASTLIERYYSRVRSFVSYLTNGAASSEDLTQEVFTRALTALGRFNGNYRFGPWLFRIAKNLCIDEARRSNFRPEPADPSELSLLESLPSASDDVWESVSSQFASSIVRKALDQLGWRQRTVLILKELEGMSYAEIAEVIGTNVRGVEATLRRARANFRLAVARAEQADTDRASCVRTLRLIAEDPSNALDAQKHLRACPECRSKASSIRSADKLLGLLPPIATGTPAWKSQIAAHVAHRGGARRGLLEILRGHASFGFASPIAQLAQFATSLTLAASVSVASMTGVVRLVATAGAPEPAVSAATAEDTNAGQSVSPQFKTSEETTSPSSTSATPEAAPALPTKELAGSLDRTLNSVSVVSSEVLGSAAKVAVSTTTGQLPVTPGQNRDSQGSDAPGSAVLSSPVALPRRRPGTSRRPCLF